VIYDAKVSVFAASATKIAGDLPISSPRRYPYFDVVLGLAWSYDPEGYAGGSVAAGRVSHAGQVKGDNPYKKG
jgi:hypothetical protein